MASPATISTRSRMPPAVLRYTRQGYFVALVAATGAGMGLVAVAFQELLKGLNSLFFGRLGQLDLGATLLDRPYIALVPTLGGLLVGLYYLYAARRPAGHGVTEVILALETRQGRLPWISSVHTAIGSSITIGSGGSAGPEGPIIAIGAALASGLGQVLHLPPQRLRTLLAAGAAAGLSGMYHAPLTGAAFSAEVLLEDLDPRNFSLLALAAVAANAVAGQFKVEAPVTVPALPPAPWQSVPLDLVLGLIAAPCGVALLLGVHTLYTRSARLRWPPYVKPAVGGLIVGVIGLVLPRVLGSGQSGIDAALHDQIGFGLLLVLPLAKLVATSITLGSGTTGGVFTPSLFIGATLGGAFGVAARHIWPSAGPEPAFALVGMGTVVAAAVNAPLTAVLLVCEFTHDFTLLPQVVAAVAASVALARRLHPDSIYTLPLSHEGIDLRLFRRSPLARVRVRDALTVGWPLLDAHTTLTAARAVSAETGRALLPLTSKDGRFQGLLYVAAVAGAPGETPVASLATSAVPTIAPDDSLHDVALLLGGLRTMPDAIAVVEPGGRYRGMLEPAAILRSYGAAEWPEHRLKRRAGRAAEL
jgi:chloride channel protein, CIC family